MWAPVDAQRAGAFIGSSDDPAIGYASRPLNNAVVEANKKPQDGAVQLTFDGRSGFSRSALEALKIPVDSQLLVFSRASDSGANHVTSDDNRSIPGVDRVIPGMTGPPGRVTTSFAMTIARFAVLIVSCSRTIGSFLP